MIAAAWVVLALGAACVAVDEISTRIRCRRLAEAFRRRALRRRMHWRGSD